MLISAFVSVGKCVREEGICLANGFRVQYSVRGERNGPRLWCRNMRLSVHTSADQEVDAGQEVVSGHVLQGLLPRDLLLQAGLHSSVL